MAGSEQPSDPTHPINMPEQSPPPVPVPLPSTDKPASPAKSPSVTSAGAPQRRLWAALKATDIIIGRLNKLMSTADGQERVFAVVGYLSHTLHHILASAPWIALQTRLSLLARLRANSKPSPSSAAAAAPKSSPLLALSALMSETRYALRLLGLFPLWAWGSATLKSPPSDPVIYALTLLQVASNTLYQALENVGYLSSKGIASKRFVDRWGGIDKWYLWSTRFWFGHIILQFFVLWRAKLLHIKAIAEGVPKEKEEAMKSEVRAWKKSLVNNTCWAPLCLHWSVEQGIGFPGQLTGFVSFLAGAWGFYDLWASTA